MVDELTALLEKVSRRYDILNDLTDRFDKYGLSFDEEDNLDEGVYLSIKSSSDYLDFKVRLDEANQEIELLIDAEDISEEEDAAVLRKCLEDYRNLVKALNETSTSKGIRIKEERQLEDIIRLAKKQRQEIEQTLQERTALLDLERILLNYGFEKVDEDSDRVRREYKKPMIGIDDESFYSVTVDARYRQLELYMELSPPNIGKLLIEDLEILKAELDAEIKFSEYLDITLGGFAVNERFIYESNLPKYKDPDQIELDFEREAA